MNYTDSIITTNCGKKFEVKTLETVTNGNINANANYTYTIYRTPTQEYIQKKSFFNPAMNHTSINYEVIPETALAAYKGALTKV